MGQVSVTEGFWRELIEKTMQVILVGQEKSELVLLSTPVELNLLTAGFGLFRFPHVRLLTRPEKNIYVKSSTRGITV